MKKFVKKSLPVENVVGGGHFYLVDENADLTVIKQLARKRFLVFFVTRQEKSGIKEEAR